MMDQQFIVQHEKLTSKKLTHQYGEQGGGELLQAGGRRQHGVSGHQRPGAEEWSTMSQHFF